MHIFKIVKFLHFTNEFKEVKSSKVTPSVSGRVKIQTLYIIRISAVELGAAQPLWANNQTRVL